MHWAGYQSTSEVARHEVNPSHRSDAADLRTWLISV